LAKELGWMENKPHFSEERWGFLFGIRKYLFGSEVQEG